MEVSGNPDHVEYVLLKTFGHFDLLSKKTGTAINFVARLPLQMKGSMNGIHPHSRKATWSNEPEKAARTTEILVVMPAMAVFATVVLMMPLSFFIVLVFIVFGWPFPFNINPSLPFDIVWTATVNLNAYPWWCRHIAIDADIHIRRTWQSGWRGKTRQAWQAWRCGKSGFGFIEADGDDDCCNYQHGNNRF